VANVDPSADIVQSIHARCGRSISDYAGPAQNVFRSLIPVREGDLGVETGFLEFHPLAMGLEYRAAGGLKTVSNVLTSNAGKAKILNIITSVCFPIDSTRASGSRYITYK